MSDLSENKASRGSIAPIIITALSSGDKYGYEICKEIERLSNGVLILKQPSLYSSLRRMEEQDLISSYWQDSEIGGKRHYYKLTEKGEQLYNENKDSLNMEDLINNLPLNEFDIEKSPNNAPSVASQENLFNLVNKKNEIKLIKEDDLEKEDNSSFVQFDLFDQKVNFIKDESKNTEKVSLYSNKYEQLDQHTKEIEPIREKQDIKPITRDSIFKPQDIKQKDIVSDSSFLENKCEDISLKDSYKSQINEISSFNEPEKASVDAVNLEQKTSDATYDSSKIVWNMPISEDNDLKEKSNDYKLVISELYNSSKLKDPYEETKYSNFKEIFPTAQVNKPEKNYKKRSEIDDYIKEKSKNAFVLDNLNNLKEQFSYQGLKIKIHNNDNNKNNIRLYSDINRLNMTTSWYVSLIMILEVILLYITLNSYDLILRRQTLMYFLGGSLAVSLFVIATLENYFDRYKLLIIKRQLKYDFVKAFLIFIFACVITFAVCLVCGMQSLGQIEFLSYWLVPVLLSSNILTYCLIFHSLLKSKHYNN